MKLKTVENDLNPESDLSDISKSLNESRNLSKESIIQSSDSSLNRFECLGCGYIYDPEDGLKKFDVAPGTPFHDLDKLKFRCPVCRVGFDAYKDIGLKSKPSGFEENLGYGFGFNKLPSGQKNVLIFGAFAFAAACFLSLYSLK